MSLNVYVWSSVKSLKPACLLNKAVGYVLEYRTAKGDATLNNTLLFGEDEKMTANGAELYVLKKALSRINIKCELNIYTESAYVAGAVKNGWTDQWKANGWKTKAGKDVANRKQWEELLPLLEGNTVIWHVKEPYPYRNWLKDEVEKNRRFVAPVQQGKG
jgi:ribonuclease HI